MRHFVARTHGNLLIAHDVTEMSELFHRIRRSIPGIESLCVMPNHLHMLHARDVRARLASTLGGYVLWRNHRRGESGGLFQPLPEGEPLVDAEKIRRAMRYVHLNPCRGRIACDPLAWPFSTHLDALGLARLPLRPAVRDPVQLHRYVSADPSVNVGGTDFPVLPRGDIPLENLRAATSAAFRIPVGAVTSTRGPARATFLEAARELSGRSVPEIARFAGVNERTVYRTKPVLHVDIGALAGDPRLESIDDAWFGDVLRRWRHRRPTFDVG